MITQKRLKELVDYDPSTGIFTWKTHHAPKAIKGRNAGQGGRMKIDGIGYRTTRLAWLYVTGEMPEGDVIRVVYGEGDKISNLRLVKGKNRVKLDNSAYLETDEYAYESRVRNKASYETENYYVICEGNVRTHIRKPENKG